MSDLSDGLDAFRDVLATHTDPDVVDDPAAISPPCVFVDVPSARAAPWAPSS